MKLFQLLKLSHADFVTRKKTIALSALAASVLFIVLLTLNLLAHGAINLITSEATKPTNGNAYLLVTDTLSSDRISTALLPYDGEILAQLTESNFADSEALLQYLADIADIDVNKLTITPGQEFVSVAPDSFTPINIFFSHASSYNLPYTYSIESLRDDIEQAHVYLIQFPNAEQAYYWRRNFYQNRYNDKINIQEVFTNTTSSYASFMSGDGLYKLLQITFLIIAGIIAIGTYVYLLDQSMRSMVIYRALGANTFDLVVISLGYIIEVSLTIIGFTIIASLLLALLVSGLNASYITELFTNFYGYAPDHTILIGFGEDLLYIVATILLTAPLSLILTLDQFSVKRLSRKLKQD